MEENNDLREKISYEKLKNIMLKKYYRSVVYGFSCLFITVWAELILCIVFNTANITCLPVKIVAWLLYLLFITFTVKDIICIVRIKKDKIHIVKDILIDKKLNYGHSSVPFHFSFFVFSYQFTFSKFGGWSIPRYNYEWSEFYGPMKDEDVYEQAEVTDSFYIIYVLKKYCAIILNTRLFDLEGIEKQ